MQVEINLPPTVVAARLTLLVGRALIARTAVLRTYASQSPSSARWW
jgi:Na+/glutamate symporter